MLNRCDVIRVGRGYQVQVLDIAPPIVSWYIRKLGFWNKGCMIALHIPLGFPVVAAEVDVLRPGLARQRQIVPTTDLLAFVKQIDREVLIHAAAPGTVAS